MTALVFGVAAYLGAELTRQSGRVAALWPANGILLAIMMLARKRELSAFFVCAFIANVVANRINGDTLPTAFFLAACNSLEVGVALLLMRLYALPDWTRLELPRVLAAFWVSVCLLAPLAAAVAAALGLTLLEDANTAQVFGIWFMADAMGLAIVTPLVLLLMRDGFRTSLASVQRREALFALLLLVAITLGVFYQSRYPFIFLVFPPLVVVAFFADFFGVALGMACVSIIAIALTVVGKGPLSLIPDTGLREQVLVIQVFLAALVIMGFPVAASLNERRKVEQALEKLATTDPLTGLATRRRFAEYFHTTWASALRERTPVAVMMVDIDFFKRYNDSYGHPQGDECIKTVAGLLRSIASRPLDMVVRYGGEEFLLLLPDTSLQGAGLLAAEIHQSLGGKHIQHRESLHGDVTVSIGLEALIPDAGMTSDSLIAAADRALYEAKRAGRARTEVAGGA